LNFKNLVHIFFFETTKSTQKYLVLILLTGQTSYKSVIIGSSEVQVK